MKRPQKPPRYPYKPIWSLGKLSLVLGVPQQVLEDVAKVASSNYRLAKAVVKPDGSIRQPFDALEPLKGIQKRIKERLLDKVIFPDYLTGSLKGRDSRTNAALHSGSALVLCEDISNFFPSTTAALVERIWSEFFGFSPDVARLLTLLTTKDAALPQGACTSSHLANLAFWQEEHALYERLQLKGIRYSRYVDDVAASSKRLLSKKDLSRCIADIYAMMGRAGYKPKRKKQEIQRGNRAMRVTKLVTNRHPAIPAAERKAIRAAVYQLEQRLKIGNIEGLQKALNSASGRVSRLCQMHPAEGLLLKLRISEVRASLRAGLPAILASPCTNERQSIEST
ncbi:reverse transcriptase family protein [Xanthomonas sontii]|uniref:reverse transcriptase family protein n=1 Tax=Xanthomonas sontii TaxID=2650745 RepID=UPI003F8357C6